MIKNLRVLTLFIATSIFVSCSSEDDSSNQTNGDITGTWEMVEYNYTSVTTLEDGGQSYTINTVGEAIELNDVIYIFNEDGTLSASGSYVIEATSEVMGQTATDVQEFPDLSAEGEYVLSNNTLEVSANGETVAYDIEVLNDTTLKITTDDHEQAMGMGMNALVDLEITFTRQ